MADKMKRVLVTLFASIMAIGASVAVANPAQAAGPYYWYAGGKAFFATPTATLAAANMTVDNPWVDTADSGHSIAEIAVIRGTGATRQILEIGWGVNINNNNDLSTRLWVAYWKNNVFSGYNPAAFVPSCSPSPCAAPNDVLISATPSWTGTSLAGSKQFRIERTATAWWFAYDGKYIGYIPDSTFSGVSPAFTAGDQVQFFGEVASVNNNPSCTDMGNMLLANATTGAYFSSSTINTGFANLTLFTTDAAKYNAQATTNPQNPLRTFRYGGPSSC